jgi:hypothetical protein
MKSLADVQFKVAMDNEQAKLKNHHTITVNVSFDGVDEKLVQEMAMKAQIVAWQSQIRANWDQFITDGLPKTITFGEALYESKRGVVTEEKAKAVLIKQLSTMTQEEKLAYLRECGLL